jgi:hypothetical protein
MKGELLRIDHKNVTGGDFWLVSWGGAFTELLQTIHAALTQ